MATFVLVHGAGSTSWYWHRVVPLLEGHEVTAVDLPCDDDTAGFDAYAAAIGDCTDAIVVAQSLAGFAAPQACENARMLVLLNAMMPAPHETAGAWWDNTGQPQAMTDLAGDGRSAGD